MLNGGASCGDDNGVRFMLEAERGETGLALTKQLNLGGVNPDKLGGVNPEEGEEGTRERERERCLEGAHDD